MQTSTKRRWSETRFGLTGINCFSCFGLKENKKKFCRSFLQTDQRESLMFAHYKFSWDYRTRNILTSKIKYISYTYGWILDNIVNFVFTTIIIGHYFCLITLQYWKAINSIKLFLYNGFWEALLSIAGRWSDSYKKSRGRRSSVPLQTTLNKLLTQSCLQCRAHPQSHLCRVQISRPLLSDPAMPGATSSWRVKGKKVKVAHLIQRHLQSWTAALYNPGSGSWLFNCSTVAQASGIARTNGLLGPQLQPAGILRPNQPR